MTTTELGIEVGSQAPSITAYVPRVLLRHLAESPEAAWWTAEGSVVFVDISGFTKLSEKLAKAGKEGAEQVTDAIEACFTDLLAVAYANEGSLIKFGGDALLLWFEGEDHVADACRSAVWMRRALREVGRIEVPGSHVQLRMSVGVHTDTFHFFHVGGSHRELVVTGPGWTRTVSMEHAADAGEILLSPEIVERLPPRCVGAAKGPGMLLKREPPGHHLGNVAPPSPVVDPDTVAHCLSTAVRTHVLAGGGTPEHRQVSIAFVHFDGTDEAIRDRGAEAVAADLHALLADTQAACDEYGVCFLATDADDDGGKLILTAGAPTITGNDEERVLLALRKLADGERTIPVRIGVNRGSVFAGDIGPWYRRTYTVMGDAVNLAARLMAQAEPGQIYATADVLDTSGTRFATVELEPFLVKGKAKPVQAWAVGDAIGSRTRDASVQLPLIGRDEELAMLRGALAEAEAGHGSMIELVGEPGIGKTRLIEELQAGYEGRVVMAMAEAFTSASPYIIWRELLRDVLGVGWEADDATVIHRLQEVILRDPELVPWLPLVAIAVDVDMPMTPQVEQLAEEFRQAKLHEVMGRFLAATLNTPTLIHVEDAHQMDGSSGDLFAYLLRDLGNRPWLITTTRRDAEDGGFVVPEDDRARSVRLQPLDRACVESLVEAATEDAPLLPHNTSLVVERSGGNPQFALDLAQVVAVGGMLPSSVETAAMARIDALAPGDRALVRRASVLGAAFHPRFLEEVLDADEPHPDDETWQRLGEFFADEGDGYLRFRRAVVRDAAYSGLPFRTRRALHANVAARFEREYNPAETGGLLSLHNFLAGNYDQAWGYARQAAHRAAEQFAHQEAAQLFKRAVDAGKHLPELSGGELAETYEALGDEWRRAGDYQKAGSALAGAAKVTTDDQITLARILERRAWIDEAIGKYPQALRWVRRGMKELEGIEGAEASAQRSRLQQFYATVLLAEGRATQAIPWANDAVGEARAADDQVALASAYDSLDWANMSLGRPAGEFWRLALEIYEELEDVGHSSGIQLNLGAGLFYDGRWDEALDAYEKARAGRLQVGDHVMAALAADNIAEIHCERGEYDEAERLLRDDLRVWRASGNRWMLGNCLEVLARVISRTGRPTEARQLLAEAREAFVAVGAREDAARADAREAECLVLVGEAGAALAASEEARSHGAATGDEGMTTSLLVRVRGFARAQRGELDAARADFEESLATAQARGDDYDVALGLLALARLSLLETGTMAAESYERGGEILVRLGVIAVPVVPIQLA